MQNNKKVKPNSVVALCIVSESELVQAIPDYTCNFEVEKPTSLKLILWGLGMDISMPYERQDGLMHRNKLNQVVTCSRWVGNERVDADWINSGYASREAIDKASGSKMVEDAYRMRQMTEDQQAALERRDQYTVIQEVD